MPIMCIPFYIFTTILVHRIFDDTKHTKKIVNSTKTIFKRIKSNFFLLKSHQNKEDNHKWNFLIPFVIEFLIEFSIQFWIWFNFCNGMSNRCSNFIFYCFFLKLIWFNFRNAIAIEYKNIFISLVGFSHLLKTFHVSLLTVKQTKLSIEV